LRKVGHRVSVSIPPRCGIGSSGVGGGLEYRQEIS